ncbi:MAG: helix-turn-helix domain-containing protein [Candidatus Pacearchaeota archaeon]
MIDFGKLRGESKEDALVDAIEQGRIVKVSEDYARKEGLLILRKTPHITTQPTPAEKKQQEARLNKGFIGMEDLRKPLRTKDNELLNELVDNFHWLIVQKRKLKGLTRKKVAEELGETEVNIKMIENGVLPASNFVLINKLESYYGISLRKNKIPSGSERPLRHVIDFASRIAARAREKKAMESKDSTKIIDDVNAIEKEKRDKEEKEILDLSGDSSNVDISKL